MIVLRSMIAACDCDYLALYGRDDTLAQKRHGWVALDLGLGLGLAMTYFFTVVYEFTILCSYERKEGRKENNDRRSYLLFSVLVPSKLKSGK
jgi:hypothetical protein